MDLGLTDKNGDPLFTEEMLQLKVFETQLIAFSSNLKAVFGENGALTRCFRKCISELS